MRSFFLLFVFVVYAAGCSSEYSKSKGLFLSGCIQSGASEKVCRCIFKELEKEYTLGDIQRNVFNRQTPEFKEYAAQATMTCMSR